MSRIRAEIHQAVQRLKIDLSHHERAEFRFSDWNADDGMIRRSSRFDPRNAGGS